MRHVMSAVLLALVLAACQPSAGTSLVSASETAQPTSSEAAPSARPEPPPRPSHCDDYAAMERGEGHPENQHWFNYLDARGYARVHISCVYGWGTAEWECLDSLWRKESSWNHTLRNGIPQAMPASKMADPAQGGGADWQTNPRTQVRWGARYIANRYGTPLRANFHGHTHYGESCHAGY